MVAGQAFFATLPADVPVASDTPPGSVVRITLAMPIIEADALPVARILRSVHGWRRLTPQRNRFAPFVGTVAAECAKIDVQFQLARGQDGRR